MTTHGHPDPGPMLKAPIRNPDAYVWGVDPGIRSLAVAFASLDDTRRVDTATARLAGADSHDGELMSAIADALAIPAGQWSFTHPPACVWVEQPSGRGRNLTLCYATGVILAVMFRMTGRPVWSIAPSAWKVATVGGGNATKAAVTDWVTARGITTSSQDETDAAAIALAGREKFLTRQWEARVA